MALEARVLIELVNSENEEPVVRIDHTATVIADSGSLQTNADALLFADSKVEGTAAAVLKEARSQLQVIARNLAENEAEGA